MSGGFLSRRQALATAGGGTLGMLAAGASNGPVSAAFQKQVSTVSKNEAPFLYCLNMATIRKKGLDLLRQVEIAHEAGYDAIEPWMSDIAAYKEAGGSLKDLGRRIADWGMSVESAIGFARWVVDDEAERAKGLEQMKREMDDLALMGGKRIAAPPVGMNREGDLDLRKAAERYRALLEIGDETGVVPQLETWGHSKNLSLIGEAAFVLAECGHPKACHLPDVYHIYKSGSPYEGLNLFAPGVIQVFHMNDYPPDPPRETIADADRVYPGDGIAPLDKIISDLRAKGGRIVLSLELFNPEYRKQDPLEVAKTGLSKMKRAV